MFGINKDKTTDISRLVGSILEGTQSTSPILTESSVKFMTNEAERANLGDEIEKLHLATYIDESTSPAMKLLIAEDAKMSAKIITNGIADAIENKTLNENATLSLNGLTTSIATTIRNPYQASWPRMYDTKVADKNEVTIETAVPTVFDINGVEEPIIDVFSPTRTSDFFTQRCDITIQSLADGLPVPTKNFDILAGMDKLYHVDKSIQISKIDVVEADGTTPVPPEKVKMKKGSQPYFSPDKNLLYTIFEVTYSDGTVGDVVVTASIDFDKGIMNSVTGDANVKMAYFTAIVSHEEHTHPIRIGFKNSFNTFIIPTREHIEVSVTQETKTDISNSVSSFSNQDIVTRMTEQVSVVQTHMENERLRLLSLASPNEFIAGFDSNAPARFAFSDIQWIREEFVPFVDQICVRMKSFYNVDDCHFRIAVSPYILRLIDAEYTKDDSMTEDQKGGGLINYSIGVKTKTNSMYFISTEDVEAGEGKIHLICNNFKTSQIKTYLYFKYSAFVTDNIRRADNPVMPATVYSERNKEVIITPLGTELKIENLAVNKVDGSKYIMKVV